MSRRRKNLYVSVEQLPIWERAEELAKPRSLSSLVVNLLEIYIDGKKEEEEAPLNLELCDNVPDRIKIIRISKFQWLVRSKSRPDHWWLVTKYLLELSFSYYCDCEKWQFAPAETRKDPVLSLANRCEHIKRVLASTSIET